MKNCRFCGSVAQLYHVVGGRYRVACSATDCSFHGKDGTIDDWCPGDGEGAMADTEAEAIASWNELMTEFEDKFWEWIKALSKDVPRADACYLGSHDNDRNGWDDRDFCPKCVEIQRWVEKHNKSKLTHVHYPCESPESDSTIWCDRCGILLYSSPTDYCIETEANEGWPMIETMTQGSEDADAAILFDMYDFGGSYACSHDKWWAILEPHARRWFEAAVMTCQEVTHE